jgi:hypothetical protein
MSQAQATPFDKLIGQSLTVGNLIFSGFQAQNYVGVGPSAVDVQAIFVTDPDTGKLQTGLRFVAPISQGAKDANTIVINVFYRVTDTTGQLKTIAQSINASETGQAFVYFFTDADSALVPNQLGSATPTLTLMATECVNGVPCASSAFAGGISSAVTTGLAVSAPLLTAAGSTDFYVSHQVQLIISNRKGVHTGTTTLQEFDVLYSE